MNIKNNNEKRINLCYTYNFFLENYISYSKNENCLNLEEHKENDLIMYNPWNKYLKNKNNLFEKTDFYYLIISTDNENWINNLEFSFKEETIEINSEVAINDFMNVNHSQTNIIKSSEIENKYILIQFSPIINLKNSINSINDEFTILSQFDINNILYQIQIILRKTILMKIIILNYLLKIIFIQLNIILYSKI